MYVDPDSGFQVFTEVGLRARDRCCGSGCRHCPFQHERVALEHRARRIQRPAILHGALELELAYDVLFWSGGKDSLLAARALGRDPVSRGQVLLTTFDASDRVVAHQEISIEVIARQAGALGTPLIGVPLHDGQDYVEQVTEGLSLVPTVGRIVFGDLHLEPIRQWREQSLGPVARARKATLHFPLWHVDYGTLLDDLEASGVPCAISAVGDPDATQVAVGELFERGLCERLPAHVDRFAERGEFHTVARVWESADLSIDRDL